MRLHLSSGGLQYEKCPTLILRYECTSTYLTIVEYYRRNEVDISKNESRNPYGPSPKNPEMADHMCLCPKNYLEPLFELKKCAIRKKQKQLLLGII